MKVNVIPNINRRHSIKYKELSLMRSYLPLIRYGIYTYMIPYDDLFFNNK
jgi:hypothetical protein